MITLCCENEKNCFRNKWWLAVPIGGLVHDNWGIHVCVQAKSSNNHSKKCGRTVLMLVAGLPKCIDKWRIRDLVEVCDILKIKVFLEINFN